MSTLLEQASLVLIPSGYKEDVVYSQIPTSGAGDLSFTRASNGTRVNSAGLVEVVAWNLAEQSETFDNAIWVKTTDGQVTISANATTAPNGTTTADKMIASANAGFHCVAQTRSLVAGVYTISVYAKASEYTFLQIFDSLTTDFANFNLTTGAVATVDQYTATIENVGNGWYRCTASKSNPSGNFVFRYGIVTTGTATRGESFTGNGVNGLFIWGAQLNIGSTAKPYFPTTDRLNVPRLTYQNGGGGCPSLLLEKQSTNLFTYSEQIDNAAWFYNNLTITANQAISPDGTQNADLLDDGTASSTQHWIYQGTSFSNSTAYTISFYAKYVSRQYMTVNIYNGSSSQYVAYNIQNGTILGSTGDVTASITSVGNGWYKIVYTRTMAASGSPNFRIGLADDTGSETYTGSNKQVYVWGFQCEPSSYVTSYIPTTSASATRVADACLTASVTSLIGQTEGVMFIDFNKTASLANSFFLLSNIAGTTAGSYQNGVYIFQIENSALVCDGFMGNVQQFGFILSALSIGRHKIAVAYKANDFAIYVDGVLAGTDTSGTVPQMNYLTIGGGVDVANQSQSVNQVALFKTKLTNAELIALTTL
jgi:hypothetical protein